MLRDICTGIVSESVIDVLQLAVRCITNVLLMCALIAALRAIFAEVTCFRMHVYLKDRLCGLVVRVPGCYPRGPGFDTRRYQIFCLAAGLERGPLSFVSINEELLEREVAASV
jgi:hypothetical protein